MFKWVCVVIFTVLFVRASTLGYVAWVYACMLYACDRFVGWACLIYCFGFVIFRTCEVCNKLLSICSVFSCSRVFVIWSLSLD